MQMLFAYLDPVTGSALAQLGLAALAVAGLGWQYVRKGFRWVAGRVSPKAPDAETTTDAGEVLRTPES